MMENQMDDDPLSSAVTMPGKDAPIDVSIGDGPTMRPNEGRGGRGAFVPGDVIAGRYVVERMLGEGGMGIVYQCLDRVGGVVVAVKCLPPEVSRNADEMEDIRANYRIVSDLHHSNIAGARTLELDESTGDCYLVMDLARGMSLKRWMRRNPQATTETKLAILRQVAAALDYAHARKVLHRDVKPENVMVDDEGGVKVLDFGLAAQIRSSQSRTSAAVTSRGGTPGYKSPEQWRGKPQREPADVYSFGVMAYWMFAGALPFDGDDLVVLGHAVLTEPVEPIAGLPSHMNAALAKALAKQPEARFASCGAFMDALEGKKAHERVARKGGMGKGLIVATLLAALAGGAWWWSSGREGTKETPAPMPIMEAPPPSVAANIPQTTNATHNAVDEVAEVKRKAVEEAQARERAAEFVRLRTRINIKTSDAKRKMDSVARFRADPDGLADRIASADRQWKTLAALATPSTLEEARAVFNIADKAEAQISLDLDWLDKNKEGRDAAKAAASEIDAMLKGDAATFKAERYAAKSYKEAAALRRQGDAAFGKGEFVEAGRLMREAMAKLRAAASDAKAFMVKTTLESAKTYLDASKWFDCIAECDKVLGWDAENAEAKEFKSRAEEHLVPSARAIAKIGDREVRGAKFIIDGTTYNDPIWKDLSTGRKIPGGEVEYSENGKRYIGTLPSHTVDWRGPKTFVVQLKEYTGPKHKDVKTLTLPGGATMEMIYVAPGSFMMGSNESDNPHDSDEMVNGRKHSVKITNGFWLGKYEVTQKQWQSVMSDNPSYFKGDDRPVEQVSWEDCQRFITKVDAAARRQFGGGARLPTEAEWEYACRAGTDTSLPSGENLVVIGDNNGRGLNPIAWYGGNSSVGFELSNGIDCSGWNYKEFAGSKAGTHPVGKKAANNWGFYDMIGNVWEWCHDWYGSDYYKESPSVDPQGPASGEYRVLRGGGWSDLARYCRSANRFWSLPGGRNSFYGFRLCCSAGPREGGTE